MGDMMMMQESHLVKGLDPIADAFDGTVNSDVVSMRDYGRARFIIHQGVGATGSSTLTVEACDDVVPTNTTAIAFWSRETLTGDTEGAITRRAAAGFVYTVQSSKIIEVEVEAKDLPAGKPFVRLHAVESVNSPCLAGILIEMGGKPRRYSRDVNATVIV
jgi:hypothetical protein